ncbi:MAG: hypothetical protein M1825_006462 [Sarcosagium campestre]|nr:MAG: hypothetical protein M1825_006462 [Sarcosagium campestre]
MCAATQMTLDGAADIDMSEREQKHTFDSEQRKPTPQFLARTVPELLARTSDPETASKILANIRLRQLPQSEHEAFLERYFQYGRTKEAMEQVRASAVEDAVRALEAKMKAQQSLDRDMPTLVAEMETVRKARAKAAGKRPAKDPNAMDGIESNSSVVPKQEFT